MCQSCDVWAFVCHGPALALWYSVSSFVFVVVVVLAKAVVAVVMTVIVSVIVSVGVLFSRGMLMRFPAMPVDINRTTHGEGQGSTERTLLEVEHVVILDKKLVLPVQPAGLESPASKADG